MSSTFQHWKFPEIKGGHCYTALWNLWGTLQNCYMDTSPKICITLTCWQLSLIREGQTRCPPSQCIAIKLPNFCWTGKALAVQKSRMMKSLDLFTASSIMLNSSLATYRISMQHASTKRLTLLRRSSYSHFTTHPSPLMSHLVIPMRLLRYFPFLTCIIITLQT